MYTAEQIAQATGAPLANVQLSWPNLLAALDWQHCNDHATRIALAATVAVETGVTENGQNMTFLPVRELGGEQASYAPWYGRGFIQCTWESNYAAYGPLLHPPLNLLANPDLLLEQVPSAQFAALYFVQRGIPAMAAVAHWRAVRYAVNGGYNGWSPFIAVVTALQAQPEPPDAPPLKGHIWHVVTAGALKTQPNHTSPAAIDPAHKPVHLAVNTAVVGLGGTNHDWLEVSLPDTPIHGWFLRESLR